jgi:hypothetical protein
MAGNLGRLNPQYYQASGEATPQAQLPEQFVSNPVAESPLSDHLTVGYESYHDIRRCPAVSRVPRMNGIRNLYHRGTVNMPIRRIGADGIPYPWVSSAQRRDMGPIRNAHFNDGLFQAGYPGWNLGLSFKVPTLQTLAGGGTASASQTPAIMGISRNPPLFRGNN